VHSLDFDFLSQVSSWIKDSYPDREIFGSFSKDIRASDYGSDGRYCLTITCTQNLKGVAAKRELLDQFFTPNGSRKDMTPQQEMEKILADIKKAKEIFSCTPAQNADAAATMTSPAASSSAAATPTTSAGEAAAKGLTPALSPQSSASAPVVPAETSFASAAAPSFDFSALGDLSQQATEADQQFDLHYGAAQDEYLISCIYLARIHALTAKAGRYGGGTSRRARVAARAATVPSAVPTPETFTVAVSAGLAGVCETKNGSITFWAENVPESGIQMQVELLGPSASTTDTGEDTLGDTVLDDTTL